MRGDNAQNRYGTSQYATEAELEAAGLFEQHPHSIFVGFFNGRPVYFHGPSGMVCTAGARAGKMKDFLSYNILTGTCLQSLIMLDLKGEGAAISRDQTADGKFCGYWNPAALHDLPQDRINPLDYMTISSPTLVSDIKVFWENMIAASGSGHHAYFEGRAREIGEGIGLALVELLGTLTFPALKEAIDLIPAGGDQWLDFAFHMSRSTFPLVRRVEAEIAASRSETGSGFQGILGELLRAVANLSDPILLASVSPPYTMSLADLVKDDQAWQLYLMPPAEFVGAWAPVLKSFFVGAMLYKSRATAANRITFFLDECGQLGGTSGFPLVPRLFTYGAGIGVQPVAVFQSNRQMRGLGPDAESLILSSAACKLMFALRDIESATDCSKMLGSQSLAYDDRLAQQRANHARNEALRSLIDGGDPLQAALAVSQQGFEAQHQAKQHRQLQLPEEVMNMASDRAILFHEDVAFPIEMDREPYWVQRRLAGRFQPNPYHPPLDRVRVMTRWGMRTRHVITEPVPARFEHYPQYRDGMWSRVKM
ncbi:MAG: type IV secretory system conjugative DNA transfer family protein [Pseudomonadota bacterium]